MWRWLPVVSVLATVPSIHSVARAQAYQPTYARATGPQLVAVYISSSWCVGNRAPGLHDAIDSLKVMLSRRAQASGRQFRMVGVALDWAPDSGVAYLRGFGAFDEVVAGMNWINAAAERFIWADSAGQPNIPQVVVYQQTIAAAADRITFGPPVVLARIHGGDIIVNWVHDGAPIP